MPVVNIDGVGPGGIRFSGPMLADIFLGKIKNWNNPAIGALNPDVNLPAAAISVIHRLDGRDHVQLGKLSFEGQPRMEATGRRRRFHRVADRRGRKRQRRCCRIRCAGEKLDRLRGVCLRHQEQACLRTGTERGGAVRSTRRRDVPGRRRERQLGRAKDFFLVMTDAPGENAYPITATAFIIMYKQPKDFGRAKLARDFFRWSLENGQLQAVALGYVPLPLPSFDR